MTISVTDDHLQGKREYVIELTRLDYEQDPDIAKQPGWIAEPRRHSEVLRNLTLIAEAQERRHDIEAMS